MANGVRKSYLISLFSISALLLGGGAAKAQSAVSSGITDGVKQPLMLPLLQDDPTAMNANPAMLGFGGGFRLDGTIQADTDSPRTGYGLYTTAGTPSHARWGVNFGFAMEWNNASPHCDALHPCDRRTTWAVGVRSDWISLGAQMHFFSSGESSALDSLVSIDVGAVARPLNWLSLGVNAVDLNQPAFNGQSIPTRFQLQLGLRPLGSDRWTLEIDDDAISCAGMPALLAYGAPRSCGGLHPDLRFSTELRLIEGLRVVGALDRSWDDSRWTGEVALALDFGRAGLRIGGASAKGVEYGSVNVHFATEGFPDRLSTPASAFHHGGELNLTAALSKRSIDPMALLLRQPSPDPLARTLATLRRMARDPHLTGVVLSCDGLPVSIAGAEELRTEITALRAAGKKVLFYLENGGDLEYYVASSADRVFVAPQAILDINGFSATVFFAAAGLDKLGVKAEFFRVGEYKNAPDLLTRSDMSPEEREVHTALLGDMFSRYLEAVVRSRGAQGVDEAKLRSLLDRGIVSPKEALESGLIDGIAHPDQLAEEVGKLVGDQVKLDEVSNDPPRVRETQWFRKRLVVVRIEGTIAMEDQPAGLFSGSVAGARGIAKRIRDAADDDRTAAILVRIDSPGGDGNASDLIWRELVRARKEKGKPVVVSMGEYAASGGYYVAAGADTIWADPSTLTGSIGVFAGHFDGSELLHKLGVNQVTVKTSESADLGLPFRPLTDKERVRLQSLVDGFYTEFVSKVSEGRHLTVEEVDHLGRGRIWTGAQAKQRGLVDSLGGFEAALFDARHRGGISDSEEIDVDDSRNKDSGEAGRGLRVAMDELGFGGVFEALEAKAILPLELDRAMESLDALGSPDTVRAAVPYRMEIH